MRRLLLQRRGKLLSMRRRPEDQQKKARVAKAHQVLFVPLGRGLGGHGGSVTPKASQLECLQSYFLLT